MSRRSVARRAHEFWEHGITVVVVGSDHSKAAHTPWKRFYEGERQRGEEVRRLFPLDRLGTAPEAVGVITGAASGNLELIEVEASEMALNRWSAEIRPALVEVVPTWVDVEAGYTSGTAHGGWHFLLRCTEPVMPSQRLVVDGHVPLIETRGARGMSIEPPSMTGVGLCDKCLCDRCAPCRGEEGWHVERAHVYTLVAGGPDKVVTIDAAEYRAIHEVIGRFGEWAERDRSKRDRPKRGPRPKPGAKEPPPWHGRWMGEAWADAQRQMIGPQPFLNRSVEFIAEQQPGNRNNRLYQRAKGCFAFVIERRLDVDDVWDALTAAALTTGLDANAVEMTLRSAWNHVKEGRD